jgi:hypothetical protein
LVDHLRWLEFEGLRSESVTPRDLKRYMGAVGAEYAEPFGRPWREGTRRFNQRSLETVAACLKGVYLYQDLFWRLREQAWADRPLSTPVPHAAIL